jgi:hypothetical protein
MGQADTSGNLKKLKTYKWLIELFFGKWVNEPLGL